MNLPLVSIIIPFYNEEKHIENSIRSALNQDYANFELILIDDNSTDQSKQICQTICDDRIKLISKGDLPKGEASSRNLGVANANGLFVTFLDGDDQMTSDRVANQLNVCLSTQEDILVGCWVKLFELKSGVLEPPTEHKDIVAGFNREYNRVTMVAGTLMCRKDILVEFPYRNKFKYFCDYDLLLRIYESDRNIIFHNIPEPLYHYYIWKKGTKFQKDWFDYNIFLRNCKFRRRRGLIEFDDPKAMYNYYKKNNLFGFLFLKSISELLKLKLKLKTF